MSALISERVEKSFSNRMSMLLAFQEIGKETCWDYLSQQLETSETLMHLTRHHLGQVFEAKTAPQTVAAVGMGTVSVGKAILGHAAATTMITRTAERQAAELWLQHLADCLRGVRETPVALPRLH
ncbi:MAG: hypothetical protein HQL79_09840 [Magnetococcales bacterium]|nr:hypothetical protein [Magnetococcales bacterium]